MNQMLDNITKSKKASLPKLKSIGLHGFTRRLYKDVPDSFDPLKKLLYKIQLNLDSLNPEPRELNTFEDNDNTSQNSAEANNTPSNEVNLDNMDRFIDPSLISNISTFTYNAILTGPTSFKWLPKQDMTGEADVKFTINNQEIDLKYHVADLIVLKTSYPNNRYISSFVKLLKLCFEFYLEDRRLDQSKIQKNMDFIQIKSHNPLKFLLFGSLHEYSLLDVFKIYFDFIIRMVEGQGDTLEWVVVNDEDYSKFHNTQIQAAIDLTGLELISEKDYNDRNLFDVFKLAQYQLDIACQELQNDRCNSDYSIYRNIVKSFGKEELEDETTFEIELTSTGSSNVYVIKDKKVLLIRNHLGDFVAFNSKKNRGYDPEIIKCFKALLNYSFKFLTVENMNDLVHRTNSNHHCFEILRDPTKFHFKGDLQVFSLEDVICKYFQYISASVSKITRRNARKMIISSTTSYDIFKNKTLWNAVKKTGYKVVGQNLFDLHKKKTIEDKLELLFNNIYKLLVANDLSKPRIEKNKKIANVDLNESDDTFTLEFTSFDTVKIAAAIGDNFVDLNNHIGDVDELCLILAETELNNYYKKKRDDIINFVKLVKLGFDHIGKSCTDDYFNSFSSSTIKIVNKNPVKFTIENSPIVYTMEDLFIKYFRYVEKSVSRRTSKTAKKVLLALPPNMNILQKTLLKSYIEQAGIKCISILSISTARLITLEFNRKFKVSGKYILIDMNTKSLTLTLFEFNSGFKEDNLVSLKNKSSDEKKIQIDIKKHKKFNIITTLYDNDFDAKNLEKSAENLLINSCYKVKEQFSLEKTLLHKYSMILQEQFSEGSRNAIIQLDDKNQINLCVDKVDNLMNEYSLQTTKLLETVLIDQNLSLSTDIIRVDYTCRLYSKQYGDLLKAKFKPNADKFNCIDGFNTQDIYDYLNDLESNSEFLSRSLSTNIGFAIAGGIFDIHLRRNQELPCKFSKIYITAFDYQTELLFPMFMGERPLVRYCESLGQIKVKNIPRSKAGELGIEMILTVDKDENLNVVAIESKSKKNLAIEFQFIEIYESKGFQLILDAIKYKVQDIDCENKIKEYKLVIKNVRENYKDYRIREEMNICLNNLNRSKEVLSSEIAASLLSDLYAKIQELKLSIDSEEISKQMISK